MAASAWVVMTLLWLAVHSTKVSSAQSMVSAGILMVQNEGQKHEFCIRYYPAVYNFSQDTEHATSVSMDQLMDLGRGNFCPDAGHDMPDNLAGRFVHESVRFNSTSSGGGSNCSLLERADLVLRHNGSGLLLDSPLPFPKLPNGTAASGLIINLPVAAFFSQDDSRRFLELKRQFDTASFLIYAPNVDSEERRFDFSVVAIFAMAILTILVGSYWSGVTGIELLSQSGCPGEPVNSSGREDEQRIYQDAQSRAATNANDMSMRAWTLLVVMMVLILCSMLVLLYFFFDKLVYVMIGIFCLVSSTAVYSCLKPVVMKSYELCPWCPTWRLPRLPCCSCLAQLEVRLLALLLFSVALTVVWAVFRNEPWAWILQDLLGIMFCVNTLKVLRLPSLRICTYLLSALFIYDIFFVFITPLITKDGKSVMVEVATGGQSGEQLPMILKVPQWNAMQVCWQPYTMLGLGDIVVPGLLVSFCHTFDLHMGHKFRIYWLITNIAYVCGLMATFVSLFLMNSAQPALLYLVPFCLTPVLLVAAIRGDLGLMWRGLAQPPVETPEAGNRDHEAQAEEDQPHLEAASSQNIRNPAKD